MKHTLDWPGVLLKYKAEENLRRDSEYEVSLSIGKLLKENEVESHNITNIAYWIDSHTDTSFVFDTCMDALTKGYLGSEEEEC